MQRRGGWCKPLVEPKDYSLRSRYLENDFNFVSRGIRQGPLSSPRVYQYSAERPACPATGVVPRNDSVPEAKSFGDFLMPDMDNDLADSPLKGIGK